jgi:hypothetical protein
MMDNTILICQLVSTDIIAELNKMAKKAGIDKYFAKPKT